MKNYSVHRCFLLSLCFFGLTFRQSFLSAQEVKLFTGPGSLSSFVIDAGGALSAWGQNFFGQLGVGFVSGSASTPLLVPFPAGNNSWQAIAAGGFHALAVGGDGRLYAWGDNTFGQLGNGITNTSETLAVQVRLPPGMTNWTQVAAGYWHSLALADGGELLAWVVTRPAGVTRWKAMAAGSSHNLAIGDDGQLYAWGNNFSGQLGVGDTTNRFLPTRVALPGGVTRWVAVAAGYSHSVAIGDDGQLYAWGSNQTGQLGNGTSDPNSPVGSTSPVRVLLPAGVTRWLAVSAGYGHNLALGDDGKLYAWGSNYSGEIGDGTRMPRSSPVPVVVPSGVASWAAFTCGNRHNLALDANCQLFAWGNNSEGGMGDGTTTNTIVPVLVSGLGDLCHPPTNREPWVVITRPLTNSSYFATSNILIQATAVDLDDAIQRVDFFADENLIGSDDSRPFNLNWSNAPVGNHVLTAKAFSDSGQSATSVAIVVTVYDLTIVTVTAKDNQASETGPDLGTFTVSRAGPTNISLTVFLSVGGTATPGLDYVRLPGSVTISPGLSSVALDVAPIDDTLIEGDETVILSAVPRSYYQVSHTTNAVVIIKDNDFITTNPPPVVIITAPDPQASEAGTNAGAFRVSRTGSTNEWLEVFYQLFGSAENGVDYQFLSNHVEIPAGRSFVDIPVRPIDDHLVEGTESVVANLMPSPFASPVEPYRIGFPSNAVVTIEDNDSPGTNLPPAIQITQPLDGAKFVAPSNVLIRVAAADPEGFVARVDFFANTNYLGTAFNHLHSTNFLCTDLWQPLPPFSRIPAGEYLLTALATAASGMMSTSGPVHVTVFDQTTRETPVVTIFARDSVASEGTNFWHWGPRAGTNSPTTNTATMVVRRSGDTNSNLTIYYSISGTASNGVDYATLPGAVTIPAGLHTARIVVVPLDDAVVENIETVVLRLARPPTNATPAYVIGQPNRAVAIIVDNDQPRPPSSRLPEGMFHLCLPAANGFGFRLECSSDMEHWMPLCTNIVTDGAIHFVDPEADEHTHRFYRAMPANDWGTDD
ncbi:MAG: hypothetical protein DME19_10490 [Verrucomicrobia bacterium]|nr:MAG: hypothetical protein DME19_10490 [Verrucomicrobiota bacterium]